MVSNNSVTIKKLRPADIAQMRSLLNLFGEVFEEKETYHKHQPSDAYLASLLDKDHFMAMVAMSSDLMVGGITAYEMAKYEQPRSEIHIYDLAVHASHRRRGIATALIEAIREEAFQRGTYLVFVQADHGDEPAIKLYENFGIKEKVLHFDIEPKAS